MRERVAALLEMVDCRRAGGPLPRRALRRQRQRVAIARAFAARPDIILCDEFLAALDTLVAARILELMARLQREHGVAYLFISHDLATVAAIADRVAVMYAGRIVETGATADIFRAPHHPYTDLLVRSVPELRTDWLDQAIAARGSGFQPDSRLLVDGLCPFRNRCPALLPGLCDRDPPPARDLGDGHVIHCHRDAAGLANPLARDASGAIIGRVN
ncbi:MAG: oligopeptide/dipeptide ABC transporter ATP-binding protein [Dongiaceae bacterium]